jgi:hypothetical protein
VTDLSTTRLRPSWPLSVGAAALVALGLAACGSSPHGSSRPGAIPRSASPAGTRASTATARASGSGPTTVDLPSNFCSLLSASEISEAVGQSMPAPQLSASGGGETDCDSNAPGSKVGLVSFDLFVDHSCYNHEAPSATCLTATSDTFAFDKSYNNQHYGPLQPISGLGQQAYCFTRTTAGVPSATVEVLEGWFHLAVFSDTCAHSQDLARLILPRI